MRTVRAFPALLAAVVVLAGCGQARGGSPSTTASDFPTGSYTGRLAFFGAEPEDTTSGALVLDLATGERVRVSGRQEAWSAAWAGPQRLAVVTGPSRISAQGKVSGELTLTAADGSGEKTPVGDVADVLEVASSADGQRLAFLGRTEPSSRACLDPAPAVPMGVYVAAGDGSAVRRVADVAAATNSLALSPDGATVAVLDHGDDTTIPAGRDWCSPGDRRLVLIDIATGAARAVDAMPKIVERPRFSPDGTTLVMGGGGFATPGSDLVFVDVATATARRVETPETSESAPTFSPDGQQLAVLRTESAGGPGSAGSIAVGRADGTEMRTVAVTGTEDQDLAWTPDGSALVVAGARVTPACEDQDRPVGSDAMGVCDVATATSDVRIVDAEGGELRQISETVSGEAGLAFAP